MGQVVVKKRENTDYFARYITAYNSYWLFIPESDSDDVSVSDVWDLHERTLDDPERQVYWYNGKRQTSVSHEDVIGSVAITALGTIPITWSNGYYNLYVICAPTEPGETATHTHGLPPNDRYDVTLTCLRRGTYGSDEGWEFEMYEERFRWRNGRYEGNWGSGRWTGKLSERWAPTWGTGHYHTAYQKLPEISSATLTNEREIRDMMSKANEAGIDFGTLALQAAESKRLLNINSLMYIKDLIELPKFVNQMIGPETISEICADIKSAIVGGKRWKTRAKQLKSLLGDAASQYLGNTYGTRLTVADTVNIADAIDRLDLSRDTETLGAYGTATIRAIGISEIKVSRRLTAVVRSWSNGQLQVVNSVKDAIKQLDSNIRRASHEADLTLSAENIWDAIPLSFVVDWFIPVGDYLSALEAADYLDSFQPLVVYESTTFEWDESESFERDGAAIQRTIKHRLYLRDCCNGFTSPKISLGQPPQGPFDHWIEGSALLLARKRK